METLIFWIVLAIIVLSNISSIRRKKKSAASPRTRDPVQAGGWRQALKRVIEEIRTEMEKASGESARGPRGPSGWDDLLSGGRPEATEPETESARSREPARTRMETKPPPRIETSRSSRIETMEAPRVDKGRESLMEIRKKRGETPEARMAGAEKRSREAEGERRPERGARKVPEPPEGRRLEKRAYSVAELRNGLIWHEILSPPVALRSPGEGTPLD